MWKTKPVCLIEIYFAVVLGTALFWYCNCHAEGGDCLISASNLQYQNCSIVKLVYTINEILQPVLWQVRTLYYLHYVLSG